MFRALLALTLFSLTLTACGSNKEDKISDVVIPESIPFEKSKLPPATAADVRMGLALAQTFGLAQKAMRHVPVDRNEDSNDRREREQELREMPQEFQNSVNELRRDCRFDQEQQEEMLDQNSKPGDRAKRSWRMEAYGCAADYSSQESGEVLLVSLSPVAAMIGNVSNTTRFSFHDPKHQLDFGVRRGQINFKVEFRARFEEGKESSYNRIQFTGGFNPTSEVAPLNVNRSSKPMWEIPFEGSVEQLDRPGMKSSLMTLIFTYKGKSYQLTHVSENGQTRSYLGDRLLDPSETPNVFLFDIAQ